MQQRHMKYIFLFFTLFSISGVKAIETSGKLLFKIDPYTLRNDKGEIVLKFQLNTKSYLKIKNNSKIVSGQFFSKGKVHEINLGMQGCNEKLRVEIDKEKSHLTSRRELFVAAIPCNLKNKITFGFIGDTQQFNNRHKKIANLVKTLQAKDDFTFILNVGDVVNYGAHAFQWDNFFNVAKLYGKNSPLVAAVGNHEYYNILAKNSPKEKVAVPSYFNNYFRWLGASQTGYAALNLGTFELLVFNSNFNLLTPIQIEEQWIWIEQKLKEAKIPVIVAMHFPPFSSEIFNESAEAVLLREKLVPLLEKYKVKLVISGHTHIYERLYKNGVTYLVTGPSGGAWANPKLKNQYQVFIQPKTLTFGKVSIDEKDIQIEIYNEKGSIRDKTLIKL